MSFDVAIFGTLVFGSGDLATWKRLTVDASRWRTIARTFPRSPAPKPELVGTLLKELPRAGWHDLFRIDREGEIYRVRGRFAEPPFVRHCRQLAALFMTAADVDARGDVYFLGEGVKSGYAVQLTGSKPTIASLDEEEIGRRSRDPELDVISGLFHVAPESIPPPPPDPPPPSPPGSSGRALLKLRKTGG
jgi:hypothetical protein